MAEKVIKEVFFIMKKYLLVSLTILFAAAFVWAADATTVEPSVDIEAEATLSWGVDLSKGSAKHGFYNEASWTVKFPLLKKADRTSTKSDVPVYGEVSLKDVELNVVSEKDSNGRFALDGKVDDLQAKLVVYGAYLTVYNVPDFTSNYAEIWAPLQKNKKYRPQNYRFDPSFDGYGTKIGYANKDFMDLDVGLKLGSSSYWAPSTSKSDVQTMKYFDGNTALGDKEYIYIGDSGDPDAVPPVGPSGKWVNGKLVRFPEAGWYPFVKRTNADPTTYQYALGFDLSMKPLDKMLGLAFTVNTTLSKDYPDANLNFGLEATSEPMDGLKLKAGFDGMYDFKAASNAFNWDTVFTAQYKWVGAGVYAVSNGTKVGAGNTDLAVFAQFVTKGDKSDATNLVEGLDAGAYIGMYKLLSKLNNNQFPLLAKVWGSYKINLNDAMWVKPFADVWLETASSNASLTKSVALAYDLGVKFSPVEKVEVQAKWQHGHVSNNVHGNTITTSVLENQQRRRFVLSLKLTY